MNTCTHTPVLYDTDIAIIGGGVAALAAAFSLKDRGNRVMIITKETYLLEDICLPYFYGERQLGLTDKKIFGRTFNTPDDLKLHAEDLMIASDIQYLYAAVPVDVFKSDAGTTILRVVGKFGLCGIRCRSVIDMRNAGSIQDRMVIDALNGPDLTVSQELSVGDRDGGKFNAILRPGPYGKGHMLIDLPVREGCCIERRALDTFKWIKDNHLEYSSMELCHFMGSAYSSEYRIDTQIERGIRAASDLTMNLFNPGKKASALGENLAVVSYNPQADLDAPALFMGTPPVIDKVIHCDAVVAGGGTAGAMAAIFLARQGVKTVLVELNGKLGGTSTAGGVSTYWFGKRHKETVELDERIEKHYEHLGLTRRPGIWSRYDDFNPDLKAYTLKEMCEEAGVEVLFNAVSFAALCEKGRAENVKGIAAYANREIVAVLSRYVIDTTGDGDIAAFSGAAFNYGSDRDAITYWASLAQYTSPKSYKNNFSTTVIVSDPKDYTRFITAGRRRGENIYDHGTYVAPRESRHIKGLYEVTLKDVASFKSYKDTMYTCFSNYDPKGKLNADMVYCGVLPPQNSAAVPLRAMIPVNKEKRVIEGLLVGGKAFSCTHNAFPGLRMQPDLQHQGAVLGIVTAEAIKNGVRVSDLNIKDLQQKISNITGDTLKHGNGKRIKPNELVSAVSKSMRLEWTDFPFEDEAYELPVSIAIMTAPGRRLLPELEKRFISEIDAETKEMLARFILWHGSDLATGYLMESINNELTKQKELPKRKGSLMCVQLLPDHGVMAETVYKLNLLAWSKRKDIHKPFRIVLDKLMGMNRDYRDNKKSLYHYVESFAYVAEHTCLQPFIPMLKDLLRLSELTNQLGTDTDILTERHKILRLSLLRALARCGDLSGYKGLVELLDAPCASISTSACMALRLMTKRPWGKDAQSWLNYINSDRFKPPVKPITKKNW